MFSLRTSQKTNDKAKQTSEFYIDSESLISSYPGCVFIVSGQGVILYHNNEAKKLLNILNVQKNETIIEMIIDTIEDSISDNKRVMVQSSDDTFMYQVIVSPLTLNSKERVALILADDITADRNIVNALISSRKLFRDLVLCSSDFAWETDENGVFTYVSNNGALGVFSSTLTGQCSRILEDQKNSEVFPFDSHYPIEDHEMWLRVSNNKRFFCRISSKPIINGNQVIAIRGVCRDLTEEHEQKLELERQQEREKLLQRIVDALHKELDSNKLLQIATTLPTKALSAHICWVFTRSLTKNKLELSMQYPITKTNLNPHIFDILNIIETLPEDGVPYTTQKDDYQFIAHSTNFHKVINGVIIMARTACQPDWSTYDRDLLTSISAHLGIAFHQIKEREELEILSRRDVITDLKNRRAFMEVLNSRIAHLKRFKRTGVLVFLDLDNFKPINDILGHNVGDQILRDVANILEDNRRAGDTTARIGGDEFAIWLEEVDEAGASHWADRLFKDFEKLKETTKDYTQPVTPSVGMIICTPDDQIDDVEELLAKADRIMYIAKNSGKSQYKIRYLSNIDSNTTEEK